MDKEIKLSLTDDFEDLNKDNVLHEMKLVE